MAFFSTSFHGTRATRCGSLCLMHGVCLFIAHFSPFGRLRLFGFVWAIGRRKKRIRAQISVSKPSGTVLLKTQLDTLRNTLRLPKTIIAKQMYLYTHSAFAFPLCIESLFSFTWRHSYLFSLAPEVAGLLGSFPAGRRRLIFLFTWAAVRNSWK